MAPSTNQEHKHTIDTSVSSPRERIHPSPAALAHVVLRTTPANFKAVVAFYLDMLQAEIICEAEDFSMLRYDFEHHRLAILQMPQVTAQQDSPFAAGLEHTAFTYRSLTDLARTYRSLRDRKQPIVPMWCVNHGMTTSMYYRDPDGNKVELQVDNFDTPEEADSFMRGPLFRENPVGTDFDPDDWSAEILSKMANDGSEGLSKADATRLKTRKEIGPRPRVPAFMYGLE